MNSTIEPPQRLTARDRLIVALDCPTRSMSLDLVRRLGDEVSFYKVGWRLFLQSGLGLVDELRDQGKNVFLDLKMDDIGETIETAVKEISGRATFLTIFGSTATASAAIRGRGDHVYPKLLQVTVLSSFDQSDLNESFGGQAPDLGEFALFRAGRSIEAGCEGLIAAGATISGIRERFGPKPIIVTPGIRPSGSSRDDQKRALTPVQAIQNGADYLVVGRPIHAAIDPVAAAQAILAEMDSSL